MADTATAAELLVVLSDPTRRQVVELLAEHPRRAGELAEAVGTSRSAMSQHLRVLVETGVIDDERLPEDARARQFRLRGEALVGIQAWLDQLQAQWRIQLDAFKRQTERKSR